MTFKVFVEDSPWIGKVRLFIHRHANHQHGDGPRISYLGPLTFKAVEDFASSEPCLVASLGDTDVDQFLQAILDTAWERGMRPKGFADHGREVSALRDHLHDMRALVYADGSTALQTNKEPPLLPSEKPRK